LFLVRFDCSMMVLNVAGSMLVCFTSSCGFDFSELFPVFGEDE
jgi:hypothetical protein